MTETEAERDTENRELLIEKNKIHTSLYDYYKKLVLNLNVPGHEKLRTAAQPRISRYNVTGFYRESIRNSTNKFRGIEDEDEDQPDERSSTAWFRKITIMMWI